MNDPRQGNLFETAETRRDEALVRVEENSGEWFPRAMKVVEALPAGWTGLGEDISMIVAQAIGPPHHHNTFGAVVREAKRRKFLAVTGRRRKMTGMKSNARVTDELMRTRI